MSATTFEKDHRCLEQSLLLFPGVKELKPQQQLVIEQIIRKRCVLGQLPTGFGKSLTYQLLPDVCKSMKALGHEFPANPLIVVVSPLSSIIEDQVSYLRSLGINAAFVGESKTKDREIVNGVGNFSFLFGSPESLAGDEEFRNMFSKEFYRKNVFALVCDEVHTVVHWGEKNKKKSPFRKWCGLVGEIRSLLPQGVPVLALTATAKAETRNKIMQHLSFNHGVEIIVSPNRKNVKLYVKKVTSDIKSNFSWLAREAIIKGVDYPRTVVYVKDYQTCGDIYNFLMHTLQEKAYWPKDSPRKSANRIIAMYHSGTSSNIQQHVLSSLRDPEGSVRIVIATSALGMGVDMEGLHRVINYGPPNDIESYVQAFGRAGRDGQNSESLLLFHGRQLRLCEPEMLDFLRSTTCRREKLLVFFGDSSENSNVLPKHLCCDVCSQDCQCGGCPNSEDSMVSLISINDEASPKENDIKGREVSEAERRKLEGLLKDCQEQMRQELQKSNPHCLFSSIDQLTCFSNSLIQDTVDNCDNLYSIDNILETISVWNTDHALKIFSCLKQVFKDLQET